MAARTAVEVAEMESELYLLRRELSQSETKLALLTQERDALKVELALASAHAREEMVKNAQIESIISQTSMGLVAALRSYHAARQEQRAVRMAAQERELGVGDESTPAFLQRRQEAREAADEAHMQSMQPGRADEPEEPEAQSAGWRDDQKEERILDTKRTGRAPEPFRSRARSVETGPRVVLKDAEGAPIVIGQLYRWVRPEDGSAWFVEAASIDENYAIIIRGEPAVPAEGRAVQSFKLQRAPKRSGPAQQVLREAAEVVGRQRTQASDHPLLPPMAGLAEDTPAGDLRSMALRVTGGERG